MKLGLLIVGWISLLATTAALANISSDYTSLKEEDCQTLNMVENLYQANCPSKQNYLLHTFSRDLRSGVDLIYHNRKYLISLYCLFMWARLLSGDMRKLVMQRSTMLLSIVFIRLK